MTDGARDSPAPTPVEDAMTGALEQVAQTGTAECRLCDHVVEGDGFGEIFEALAKHGEEEHEFDGAEGWSA